MSLVETGKAMTFMSLALLILTGAIVPAEPEKSPSSQLWDKIEARQVAISPDGKLIATIVTGNSAVVYKRDTKKTALHITHFCEDWILFSPDSKYVLTHSPKKAKNGKTIWEVVLHDLATKEVARRIDLSADIGEKRILVAVSARILIVTVLGSPDIFAYDLRTGKEIGKFDNKHHIPHLIALSPDGKWLLTAGTKKDLCVWDVAKRKLLHELSNHTSRIAAIAISSDGAWCASVTRDRVRPRLWVFDRAKGTERGRTPLAMYSVHHVFFMPEGKTLVVTGGGAYGGMNVWDWQTSRDIRGGGPPSDGIILWDDRKWQEGHLGSASMAKDGTLLARQGKDELRLLSIKPEPSKKEQFRK